MLSQVKENGRNSHNCSKVHRIISILDEKTKAEKMTSNNKYLEDSFISIY